MEEGRASAIAGRETDNGGGGSRFQRADSGRVTKTEPGSAVNSNSGHAGTRASAKKR